MGIARNKSLMQNCLHQSKTGISIISDGEIVVQANSASTIGSDSWEVPPANKLGRVHVIMTYVYPYDRTDQGPYQMMIVAAEEATIVTVELKGSSQYWVTVKEDTYHRGEKIELELNKYEVVQVSDLYSWQT